MHPGLLLISLPPRPSNDTHSAACLALSRTRDPPFHVDASLRGRTHPSDPQLGFRPIPHPPLLPFPAALTAAQAGPSGPGHDAIHLLETPSHPLTIDIRSRVARTH